MLAHLPKPITEKEINSCKCNPSLPVYANSYERIVLQLPTCNRYRYNNDKRRYTDYQLPNTLS